MIRDDMLDQGPGHRGTDRRQPVAGRNTVRIRERKDVSLRLIETSVAGRVRPLLRFSPGPRRALPRFRKVSVGA